MYRSSLHAVSIYVVLMMTACSNNLHGGTLFNLESVDLRRKKDIEYKILYNKSNSDYGIRYVIRSNINLAKIALGYDGIGSINAFPCDIKNEKLNSYSFVMTDIYFHNTPISYIHSMVPIEGVALEIDAAISNSGYVKYVGYINSEGLVTEDGEYAQEYYKLLDHPRDICINFSASTLSPWPPYRSPTIRIKSDNIKKIIEAK